MKTCFLKFLAALLCLLGLAHPAFSQGPPIPSTLGYKSGTGWIMVYIRAPNGMPSTALPQITLTSADDNSLVQQTPRREGNAWVFSGLTNGADYQVTVNVDGFEPASQTVSIPATDFGTANVFIILKPAGPQLEFKPPSGQFVLAPRVQKEVQNGIKDLNSGKLASAQKHFQKAIQMGPGNPYLNYLMGMSYLLDNQLPNARSYLEQSVSLDPNQPTSLSALGSVRYEQRDYPGAVDALNKALALDPSSWKDHWMLADACLKQGDYRSAIDHGQKALALGKSAAEPVKIVVAEASVGVSDLAGALRMVNEFLSNHPNDRTALRIRAWALRKPRIAKAPNAATTATPAHPNAPPRANWAPPLVESERPVVSTTTCDLPKILKAAQKNAEQFVNDLQQFTSSEDYQTTEIQQDESLETSTSHIFAYTAAIEKSPEDTVSVDEFRDQRLSAQQMPDHLADLGAPALVLMFHPYLQHDFSWACEGLGVWKGTPSWVVRFEQLSGQAAQLFTFQDSTGVFPLPLKGRAWLSQDQANIEHVDAELADPIANTGLDRAQFVVDYQPVIFAANNSSFWLPLNVDLYYHYRGHYLHHFHHFSKFDLVWRGAPAKAAKTAEAKSPAS